MTLKQANSYIAQKEPTLIMRRSPSGYYYFEGDGKRQPPSSFYGFEPNGIFISDLDDAIAEYKRG